MARKRAVNVCSACHERKVRCDVSNTTAPCSNCRERDTECRPRTRKRYSTVNRRSKIHKADLQEDVSVGVEDSYAEVASLAVPHSDDAMIVESVILQPSTRTTSLYVGDSGYGALMETLQPKGSQRRHINVHGTADTTLKPEDLEYLKLKGCFDLPEESDSLLVAYLGFVHPIFPILDGPSFSRDFAEGGFEKVNLLLLWSMFSVSASYVPECRGKETKSLYHMRGRLLFDLSGENDRFVLLRSALLLSFWFDNAEDVKQSWYWTGIAFDIGLSLGLHRAPGAANKPDHRSNEHGWMNAWHCCLLRDAWQSYSMGRPLRLDDARHSCRLLSTDGYGFEAVELHGKRVYSDRETRELGKMWRDAVVIAHAVRQIRSPRDAQPTTLSTWLSQNLPMQEYDESSLLLSMCSRHLRLCQSAATIATCQQVRGSDDIVKAAADKIVSIVKLYLIDSTITYAPPSIVPLIMPAMVVSVSALESSDAGEQASAQSRLSCCMKMLEGVEATYPAASMAKRLFSAARETLLTRRSGGDAPVEQAAQANGALVYTT